MASGTVPRGLVVLAVRLFTTCSWRMGGVTCSWLIFFVFYKESTGSYGLPFWLHQGRIPRHTCRFHCCLAAHQRTRKKDSAEPSFPILWTPPHPPGGIRCGGAYLLPRAYRDIVSLYPVQNVCRHFDVSFGCLVFGLGLFAFQKISLGFGRTFFIIGGMDCTFLRLRGVLL